MKFPMLKVRPRSTQTDWRFGGLWHSGEAPLLRSKTPVMRWDDMRGLGPDKYPMLSTAKTGSAAVSIDGNTINQPLIGAADGAHPVFLDECGTLYCNGHTLDGFLSDAVRNQKASPYFWNVALSCNNQNATYYFYGVEPGTMLTAFGFPYDKRRSYTMEYVGESGGEYGFLIAGSVYVGSALYVDVDGTPVVGDKITVSLTPGYAGQHVDLCRMGAYIVEMKYGRFANVEDLAAGNTMTCMDNYGPVNANCYTTVDNNGLKLTLCQMDGTPYTGAVAQSTPPSSHTSVWIDTSGNNSVAMEWSESYSTWVAIPTTYVKISPVQIETDNAVYRGVLKTGDGVVFTAEGMDGGAILDIKNLLNASHVLVEATITDAVNGTGYVIVPGTLPAAQWTMFPSGIVGHVLEGLDIVRSAPEMDYVVEAQNRLWGCSYHVDSLNGTMINEIYASALGDFSNWSKYEGLSTDSWTASRGTPAPFTGAAVLSGHPLFFREESVEKVYPSSTGAHQIQTYSIDGVQEGSDRSLVVIDELLYYQSRLGVCVYDGTMPKRIGAAFGDLKFSQGIAARHLKRYCISMVPAGGGDRIVGVYDIATGEWYLENDGWDGCAFTWKDDIYYVDYVPLTLSGRILKRYASTEDEIDWYAESGVIGYELPEHRFISCIRIRMRSQCAENQTTVKVKIMYDGGTWIEKGSYTLPASTNSKEANIFPRRCDHFRLRIEGTAATEILSMSYRMERSEGGH